jgi:hypothetical protein
MSRYLMTLKITNPRGMAVLRGFLNHPPNLFIFLSRTEVRFAHIWAYPAAKRSVFYSMPYFPIE